MLSYLTPSGIGIVESAEQWEELMVSKGQVWHETIANKDNCTGSKSAMDLTLSQQKIEGPGTAMAKLLSMTEWPHVIL